MQIRFSLCSLVILALGAVATAQPPSVVPAGRRPTGPTGSGDPGAGSMIGRLLVLDKNNDGQIEADEVTDGRVQSLFQKADADGDGVVTREELTALVDRGSSAFTPGPKTGVLRNRPTFGKMGGRKPNESVASPAGVGEILSPQAQDQLNLSSDQRKRVEALQHEFDAKLQRILTSEQRRQWEELSRRPAEEPPQSEIQWAGKRTPAKSGRKISEIRPVTHRRPAPLSDETRVEPPSDAIRGDLEE